MKCQNGHIVSGSYCFICEVKPEKKKPKAIRKVSVKRVSQNKDYSKLRLIYLEQFPVCEVWNCWLPSTQIHHRAGRIEDNLTDINNFLAVCDACHQYIELHPEWSKEHGYSISRLI